MALGLNGSFCTKFIVSFSLLSLYVHVVPRALSATGLTWLIVFLVFLPLSFAIAKAGDINGLHGLGLNWSRKWVRQASTGVVIGVVTWLILLAAELASGNLRFLQWRQPGEIFVHLILAAVVAVLGSLSNEIITRGLVFAYFRRRLPTVLVMLISTSLYALDDSWSAGFSMLNLVFSFFLGWAFSLSVARTRAISASLGMHTGLNLVYWIVHGFPGSVSHGGIAHFAYQRGFIHPQYLGVGAAILMLIWANYAIRQRDQSECYTIGVSQEVSL
jgi:membrane protease YdiL (CAAX protease family)